ncbi:MAG: ATP-binding cassette domain-containing protein, partial [Gemmatimonadota bacterium]
MIRIDSLTKIYGHRDRAVTALREVSLELGPGVWGVVGPNGAGKTTLLGLVLGFLHPTGGAIRIDGALPR